MASSYTACLTLVMVLVAMKKIDFKKIVKFLFVLNLFFILIHVFLYIVYMIFDINTLNVAVRTTETGEKLRYSFFFSHPNVFGMYVFWTLAMFFYIYYKKIDIKVYIVSILIALFIYYYPNSRTSALEIVFLVIFTALSKKGYSFKWLPYAFIAIITVSLLGIFFIENPIISQLDNLLNTRISIANIIYNNYGIHLFGNDITGGTPVTYVNGRYLSSLTIIDSSYYSLLLNYGSLSYILVIYALFCVTRYTNNKKDEIDNVMLIVFFIYALSETSCLSPVLGFPIMLIYKFFEERLWKKKLQ